MKTQPLATVLAQATQGKLVRLGEVDTCEIANFTAIGISHGVDSTPVAYVATDADWQRLAHFWNHGPELVRVLERLTEVIASYDNGQMLPRAIVEANDQARALLDVIHRRSWTHI